MNMHYNQRHQNLCLYERQHLGTLQIEMRKIEITPQYNRPPWTTIDHQQHDIELCAVVRGSNNQHFQAKSSRILKEKYECHIKIYTNGSKKEEEVGYAVVREQKTIKRKKHQHNSIYSEKQLAIKNAIYNKKKKEGPKLMITDSLSTMMAVSDRKRTKNPKTQTIRILMDQQGGKMWVTQAPQTKKP
jgi:hypothetical protein